MSSAESDDARPKEEGGGPRMGFLDHLEELRRRVFRSALAVALGFGVSLFFADQILHWLLDPVQKAVGTLAVMRPSEGFMNKMKAALVGGIVVGVPVILYQLWSFVSPGLYRRERRWILPVIASGTVLFLGGVAFCYFVAMPSAINFLAQQSKGYQSVISLDSAFAFSTKLLLGMGAVFEMPLIVLALARLGLVTPRFLWKKFDVALWVIFLIAAIVTPTPDVITCTIFALPMILLYLLSIAVAWLARPKPAA